MKTYINLLTIFMALNVSAAQEDVVSPPEPDMKNHTYMNVSLGTVTASDENLLLLSGRLGTTLYKTKNNQLTLGGFLGVASEDIDMLTITYVPMLAEVLARQIENTGFYAGVRIGYAYVELSAEINGVKMSVSDNSLTYGSVIGYEINFSQKLALSLEATWLFVEDPEFIINGQTVPVDIEEVRTLLIGLTYQW